MRGVREHVDQADAAEGVARPHQVAGVTPERTRVAGHQHDGRGAGGRDPFHHRGAQPVPGRVGHHDVGPAGVPAADVGPHDTGAGNIGQVHAGVGHGAPVRLDELHAGLAAQAVGDGAGEQPHTAVEVRDPGLGWQRPRGRGGRHGGGEVLGAGRAGLEEAGRRDPPAAARDLLVQPHPPPAAELGRGDDGGAGRHGDLVVGAARLVAVQHDEPLAGGGPGADDHLAVGAEPSGAEHLVDEGVGDQAPGGGDVDHVVGVVAPEAGPPVHHRGADRRAVPARREHRAQVDLGQRGGVEPAHPDQGVDDDRGLQGPLVRRVDVLPAAPTAPFGDQRARGLGSTGARLDAPPARWPWRTGPAPRRPAGAPGRRGWRRARRPPGRRAAAPRRRHPQRCR